MPPDQTLRRTALSVLLATASCAAPPSGPDPAVTRFNGTYRGVQSAEATADGCAAGTRPVQFRVSDGRVWNHRHGRHRRMDGNVDARGSVILEDEGGDQRITATIAGGRFSGSETVAPAQGGSASVQAGLGLSCLSRIEATLVSGQPGGADQ